MAITDLNGIQTIAGGTANNTTSVVKGGGTSSVTTTTPVLSSDTFDGDVSNDIEKAFIGASGENTHPANNTAPFAVGIATQFRKMNGEVAIGDVIDTHGDLNVKLNDREPNATGYTLLADGRYVLSDGTIVNHVSGSVQNSYEIISTSGDQAAEDRHGNPGFVHWSKGLSENQQWLEERHG